MILSGSNATTHRLCETSPTYGVGETTQAGNGRDGASGTTSVDFEDVRRPARVGGGIDSVQSRAF